MSYGGVRTVGCAVIDRASVVDPDATHPDTAIAGILPGRREARSQWGRVHAGT